MLSITSYTKVGLRLATFLGAACGVISMGVALVYLVMKLVWWDRFAAGMAPLLIGMLFLGMALLLRFSSSANEMAAESSQRVLAQVNWNLDSYLRNMMRVSDTVYYRVIKSADLEQSDTAQELRDALKLLYAKDRDVLVSLAVFDESGELISATPLTELKNSVTPSREGWFTAAMERGCSRT